MHKDKKKEYNKQYREKNKEKVLEQQRLYKEKNKEEIKKQRKEYYANNFEKIHQYNAEYYKKNKYILAIKKSKYRYINPEQSLFKRDLRYHEWAYKIKKRANFTCELCKSIGALNSHHKKKWKDHLDLRYDLYNGICLCTKCHKFIHGRMIK